MKRNALFVFALVLSMFLIIGVNSASAQQQVLYAASGAGPTPGNLMILDATNGEVLQVIGPIGFTCTGLAFALDGTLYGSTGSQDPVSPKSLIRINLVTGAGTLVGSGLGPTVDDAAADITFSPQGVLYGWDEAALDDLITINQTTGVASPPLGDSGLSTYGSGLAFAPNGTLYLAGDGDAGNLYTINPATGAVVTTTPLSGTNDWGIGGLAVDNAGTIFGIRKRVLSGSGPPTSADLITINPTSGFITSVAVIRIGGVDVENMDSLAFSPIVADIRTGFWVPAGETGQTAMSIEIQQNVLALGWGAYDDTGEATWIFSQANRLSGETFSGPLLSFTGGPCFTCSPTPLTGLLPVGTITITFTSNTTATISGSVNTVNFNKTISKTFGP